MSTGVRIGAMFGCATAGSGVAFDRSGRPAARGHRDAQEPDGGRRPEDGRVDRGRLRDQVGDEVSSQADAVEAHPRAVDVGQALDEVDHGEPVVDGGGVPAGEGTLDRVPVAAAVVGHGDDEALLEEALQTGPPVAPETSPPAAPCRGLPARRETG